MCRINSFLTLLRSGAPAFGGSGDCAESRGGDQDALARLLPLPLSWSASREQVLPADHASHLTASEDVIGWAQGAGRGAHTQQGARAAAPPSRSASSRPPPSPLAGTRRLRGCRRGGASRAGRLRASGCAEQGPLRSRLPAARPPHACSERVAGRWRRSPAVSAGRAGPLGRGERVCAWNYSRMYVMPKTAR